MDESAESAIQRGASFSHARSESRLQRWAFPLLPTLGRCPRLDVTTAPLALKDRRKPSSRACRLHVRALQPTRLPLQKTNPRLSGQAGAFSPFRTSAIVDVKSSTPVLGTMMLLRR